MQIYGWHHLPIYRALLALRTAIDGVGESLLPSAIIELNAFPPPAAERWWLAPYRQASKRQEGGWHLRKFAIN
jgi:hypothetical protein